MPENRPEDHLIDEKLAEFTDRVFEHEGSDVRPLAEEDAELQPLLETVLQVKRSNRAVLPGAEFASRLRAVLQEEWRQNGPKADPGKSRSALDRPGFFLQIKNTFRQIPASWGQRIAIAGVALLLLVLLVLPENVPLTGSAGTSSTFQPLDMIIGILCLGLLILLLIKKQD